jgi:serine/threonine protein kinase
LTSERFQQARRIFERALDSTDEPAARRAFVAGACGADGELRREVESLLDAYERGSGFSMETPLMDVAGAPKGQLGERSSVRVKLCGRCQSRFISGESLCPNDGEVLVYDPEALVGVTLDGIYRIEQLLGRGAMGMVYLARHTLLRDNVAIKVMPAELTADPDFLRRFLREGRAARAIHHPNAVTVHDLRMSSDGIAYMVMEYVDGTTLRGYLHGRGPLPPSEVLTIMGPIASALDVAHARGVVHRDLKPENIMLGTVRGEPVVKLMDLGIAKMFAATDSTHGAPTALTVPGQIMGTPPYMSPEQWGELPEDGGTDIDARADVYSFAVILFELFAGWKPFSGQSLQEFRREHVSKVAPPLHTVVEGIPAAVSAVVARALSKDRGERQATAGQVVAEMKAALASGVGEDRTLLASNADLETMVRQAAGTLTKSESRTSAAGTPNEIATSSHGPDRATIQAGASPLSAPTTGRDSRLSGRALAGGVAVALLGTAAIASWIWGSADGSPRTEEPAVVAPAPPERSLEYVLVTQKYRGGKAAGDPFASDGRRIYDTDFRVRFDVTGAQDGVLFILNEDPKPDEETGLPRYSVLFPDATVDGGSPRLAAGRPVRTDEIGFDAQKGTEKVWLVWSAEPAPPLDGLARLDLERDVHVTNPVLAAALRDMLAAAPKSEASTDEDTKRTTVRGRGPLLVHLLKLQHE